MSDTFVYFGRRFINLLIVIWIAGSLNFVIPRLMPGDPIQSAFTAMAVQGARADDLEKLRVSYNKTLGLDAPLIVQYAYYWAGISKLDFGISIVKYPIPVSKVIGYAIPWTIGLLGVSVIISFVFGTLLGAYLAWPKPPLLLRIFAPLFLVLSAMPFYLLAIVMIATFAIWLRLFPPAGGFSPSLVRGWNMKTVIDIGYHAMLPALSIILGSIGGWALGMRATTIGVLGEDFILYAQAKGLSPLRIFLRYGLRNSLLPQVTALALAMGSVVSGSVLVEGIFSYPGLGGLLFKSIVAKDIFVVNGIVTILIIMLSVSVFVIDLILPILDPRIRSGR